MDEVARLFRMHGCVEELQIDDDFRQHMADRGFYREHQVSVGEIFQVFEGSPLFFLNGGSRRAPVIMVGPTNSRRIICIPVEPTGSAGVWRVVTAFEANAGHRQRYQEEWQ